MSLGEASGFSGRWARQGGSAGGRKKCDVLYERVQLAFSREGKAFKLWKCKSSFVTVDHLSIAVFESNGVLFILSLLVCP